MTHAVPHPVRALRHPHLRWPTLHPYAEPRSARRERARAAAATASEAPGIGWAQARRQTWVLGPDASSPMHPRGAVSG